MTTVSLYGDSDIGRVRRVNEDSFQLIPDRDTMVVCDGMGGHAAGEIASQHAVETVAAFLLRKNEVPTLPALTGDAELPNEAIQLVWAVRLANRRVFLTAQAQKQTRGMGTTLVAARFLPGCAIVCHVGDSRAYLFRDGAISPITTDHSLVAELLAQNEITAEQARTFPDRNIITRALGTRPVVAVDVNVIPTKPGDWFLLCSDGLCGAIDDDEMEAVISLHAKNPTDALGALIDAANAAGGHDNITVAIGEVKQRSDQPCAAQKAVTVPEVSDDSGELESSVLRVLFDHQAGEAAVPDASTDKIAIRKSAGL